jgi:hypothetical protein
LAKTRYFFCKKRFFGAERDLLVEKNWSCVLLLMLLYYCCYCNIDHQRHSERMKSLTTSAILALPCVLAKQYIYPPEQNTCANDYFGQAVATNGNWLAVGAPGDEATCFGGYVHLYVPAGAGDDWIFVDSIGFDDGQEFGWSIDMVDDAMYASRPQALTDCGVGVSVGNVAVFEDMGGSWNQTQVLFPSNACTASTTQSDFAYIGSDMHFGYDVASYGNHMIIGTRMCNADYDTPVFNIPGKYELA